MKKNAPPGVVCHGLQENAFQVNQLYNVTWSNVHGLRTPNEGINQENLKFSKIIPKHCTWSILKIF